MGDAAALRRTVEHLYLPLHHLRRQCDQFIDAGFAAAAQVDDTAVHVGGGGGRHQRLHHVVHVDEITGLPAAAKDDQRSTPQRLVHKARHHRRMGGGQILARPVSVKGAQDHRLDAPQSTDGADIVLGGQLAHGVGGLRIGRLIFPHRLLGLLPIDRAGGCKDHATHPGVPHRLHHADRTTDVDFVVLAGVENGFTDLNTRRQVVDAVHVLQERPQLGPVGHVAASEEHPLVQPGGVARAEVVNHPHLVTIVRQSVGKGGAEESSAAGDEKVHRKLRFDDKWM